MGAREITRRRAAELEHLRNQNPDGVLQAEDVVQYARNPTTALHSAFTWDDSLAAHQWRLQEARRIIRFRPQMERVNHKPLLLRPYVSLVNDRVREGGGYRPVQEVFRTPVGRDQLVRTALGELESFARRYGALPEFAPVVEAIGDVKASLQRKRRRKRPAASAAADMRIAH